MAKSKKEIISIQSVSKIYNLGETVVKALDNVSLSIYDNDYISIMGPSGSGKSTLMNIIGCLDVPTKGKYKFKDELISEMDDNQLANIRNEKIGFVFQTFNLLPKLNAMQNVEVPLIYSSLGRKDRLERAEEALHIVGLQDRMTHKPNELSGGQRQRVAIARALVNEPILLIADEPTTALDVSIQAQILKLIKELTIKRNLAVIIITHDMGVIAEITNKVAIMRYGVIVEQGLTKDILTNPQSSEGKSLIISVPPTNKKINRFTLISPEGKEITLNSANLTKNIIKTWGVRETSNRKILNFENVSKVFDDGSLLKKQDNKDMVKALNEVTFDVFEGETLGLVGESGSGKSTIAKIITGLIKPSSGKISYYNDQLYNDRNIYQPQYSRGQVQMIFQDPYSSLNPRFKVRDIIAEPLKFYQKDLSQQDLQSNIHDLIDIAGMSRQSLDRYPHEFSGGQRQRISIARALATRPRLLICDEPTSALDVSIQAQILNLLKDIQDELHLTMLFISHDLPVIRQMCNRIVVLKDGNVCEINDSESLFNQPQHSYTKQLIDLMPKIESLV